MYSQLCEFKIYILFRETLTLFAETLLAAKYLSRFLLLILTRQLMLEMLG